MAGQVNVEPLLVGDRVPDTYESEAGSTSDNTKPDIV